MAFPITYDAPCHGVRTNILDTLSPSRGNRYTYRFVSIIYTFNTIIIICDDTSSPYTTVFTVVYTH